MVTSGVPPISQASIVVPGFVQEAVWRASKVIYAQWRHEYLLAHPQPPIFNVRFEHKVDWRDNWLSIQNAHDLEAPVWKAGMGMMVAAQFGPLWIGAVL